MSPKPIVLSDLPLALTVREAGKLTTLKERMIRKLIKRGQIRAQKIGKCWLIPTRELKRFIGGEDVEVRKAS